MKNIVVDKSSAPQYAWGDGCNAWTLAEAPSLSIKQEEMPPGTKETLHFHSAAQQFFFVLKGEARFYVEDEIYLMREGQGLLVNPRTKHFIVNEGSATLSFLVVSQPATEGDRTNLSTNGFV